MKFSTKIPSPLKIEQIVRKTWTRINSYVKRKQFEEASADIQVQRLKIELTKAEQKIRNHEKVYVEFFLRITN